MKYEEFEILFKPINNDINIDAPFGGFMFETYGKELEKVLEQKIEHIWTIVSDDFDDLYLVSGYHLVNRMGYILCEVPFDRDYEILLEDYIDIFETVDNLQEITDDLGIKFDKEKFYSLIQNQPLTKNMFIYYIESYFENEENLEKIVEEFESMGKTSYL